MININTIQKTSDLLPDRVGTGIFGLSFFSWQGDSISFADSKWMVYLIYGLLFIFGISIFLFKNQVRNNYLNHQKRVANIFQVFGFFIILLSIFRIIILVVGGYPNLWEMIPFHFCRMFVIGIGISLIFKKLYWIKYLGILAFGGGVIGLLISDLSNSEYWIEFGGMDIGVDNYIFWDYFIIHSSSIIIPIYLFTCLKPTFYKSTICYSILVMAVFTIFIFILNICLSYVSDPRWKPNWFYLGIPKLNGIDDMLEPILGSLVGYPAILFTFIIIGIFMYVGLTAIYINSDKIDFVWRDKKTNKITFKINIIQSENLLNFSDGPLNYRKKYNL